MEQASPSSPGALSPAATSRQPSWIPPVPSTGCLSPVCLSWKVPAWAGPCRWPLLSLGKLACTCCLPHWLGQDPCAMHPPHSWDCTPGASGGQEGKVDGLSAGLSWFGVRFCEPLSSKVVAEEAGGGPGRRLGGPQPQVGGSTGLSGRLGLGSVGVSIAHRSPRAPGQPPRAPCPQAAHSQWGSQDQGHSSASLPPKKVAHGTPKSCLPTRRVTPSG